MLMVMRKWEQHKTNKWVRSSYVCAYAYVAGVLTCLCLCYAYAYALVRTSLTGNNLSLKKSIDAISESILSCLIQLLKFNAALSG